MSTQTQKRNLKNSYVDSLQVVLEDNGYACERTVKGLAIFDKPSQLYVIVDAVVKNEDYDIDDAIMEWEDRIKKQKERAQKAATKAAKEQAKKDKAKE